MSQIGADFEVKEVLVSYHSLIMDGFKTPRKRRGKIAKLLDEMIQNTPTLSAKDSTSAGTHSASQTESPRTPPFSQKKSKVASAIDETIQCMLKRARIGCCSRRILEEPASIQCTTTEDTQSEACIDASVSIMIYTTSYSCT